MWWQQGQRREVCAHARVHVPKGIVHRSIGCHFSFLYESVKMSTFSENCDSSERQPLLQKNQFQVWTFVLFCSPNWPPYEDCFKTFLSSESEDLLMDLFMYKNWDFFSVLPPQKGLRNFTWPPKAL